MRIIIGGERYRVRTGIPVSPRLRDAVREVEDPGTPYGLRVVAALVVLEHLLGVDAFTRLIDRLDDDNDPLDMEALIAAARELAAQPAN
ncbi:hypothetical protein HNP84_004273 [Thermocatellispora tengchongensis]|uniref:Uncharacterized protein n=1 Tax=Thermocatellispora tengchongensis TaxID=1073253 RepID=A0A840P9L1_9ACTN|nr:hypothetical protein [Thermocatellispora tengchongensis]MBB5134541.1 hypothetical protein [Thermocatellispora tengchongensis]